MLNLGRYSGKNCPNIVLHPALTDRVMEGVAAMLLLTIWMIAFYLYKHQPISDAESIPVLYLAGIVTGAVILVAWGGYVPIRLINFPYRLTEQNQIVQYRLATRFSRALAIFIGLMGVWIELSGAEALFGVRAGLFEILLSASFGLMTVGIAVYYFLAFKNR